MASIAELKSSLHHYIAETDDVELLSKVQKYVQDLMEKEEKVVAYTAQGKPLTQSEYKKDIDEAIEQAKNGDVISQEEIDKEEL